MSSKTLKRHWLGQLKQVQRIRTRLSTRQYLFQ
jgi:hypothetical protein